MFLTGVLCTVCCTLVFKLGNKIKCLNMFKPNLNIFLQYFLQAGDRNFMNLLVFRVTAPDLLKNPRLQLFLSN